MGKRTGDVCMCVCNSEFCVLGSDRTFATASTYETF